MCSIVFVYVYNISDYDSRTICTCRVSRFARQHNGSDKRSCCETIGKFSALIIIEQAVIPLRLVAVFYKACTDNFLHAACIPFSIFFFPFSSRASYKTQMSAFFVDGFAYNVLAAGRFALFAILS